MGPATSISDKLAKHNERWQSYIEQIRERNPDALAHLYDETASTLYGLALRILNDAADAEEVVADVYQQVWRSVHLFDPSRGTVLSWLTLLTRSRAIDHLRRASARRSRELPIEPTWETPSRDPVPELETILNQERARVRHALETLSAEQRQAIELAFFSGLTHVEVAQKLGAPLGTIKTRIRVAMRKLREVLAPAGALESIN